VSARSLDTQKSADIRLSNSSFECLHFLSTQRVVCYLKLSKNYLNNNSFLSLFHSDSYDIFSKRILDQLEFDLKKIIAI